MANEKTIFTESFIAGEDLSDYQYHGVKMNGNRTVDVIDATTDMPVGVLTNEPDDGEEASVMIVGRVPIVLGGTIAAGGLVMFDADGHAVAWAVTDITMYAAGQCTIGGDEGEMGEMIVGVVPEKCSATT